MSKDVNSIVVCKEDYRDQEDFENAIKKAVMVLLDNNYIMTVRYDEKGFGIVSIDFNHANREYGCDYPHWLSPEELESIVWDEDRANEEDE